MKRRPRRIEQMVAEHLSAFFDPLGLEKVERVPIIGRTGPDIEINAFGLIVDVKSRLSVPSLSFPGTAKNGELVWTTLNDLNKLTDKDMDVSDTGKSKMVTDWLDHMHKWTEEKYPEWRVKHGEYKYPPGISAIVLHKAAKQHQAKMPVGEGILVMYERDLELFRQRYQGFVILSSLERKQLCQTPQL